MLKNYSLFKQLPVKKYFAKCCVGFSYGLSFPLTLTVLDLWLKDFGVSNTTIGIFSLFHWPFTLKFMCGIFIENYDIAYFSQKIGRERSWIIVSHFILIAGIIGMANSNPSSGLQTLIFFATLTALGDGCKNIVLYPYQINGINKNQFGYVASVVGFGHKIGIITTKVLALYLANIFGWKVAYYVAAVSIFLLMIMILFIQPPQKYQKPKRNLSFSDSVEKSLTIPFKKIIEKKDGLYIVLVLSLYKSADFMMQKMSRLFLMEIGFSKIEMANIVQLFGSIAAIVGGLTGGYIIKKIGIPKAMIYFGNGHAISFFSYLIFTKIGANVSFLSLVILGEAFTGGCVTSAFLAFLYTKCKTGSLYALLWAFHEMNGIFFMGISGIIADGVGWRLYFTLVPVIYSIVLAILWGMQRRISLKHLISFVVSKR
ncbi:MAG: MFS transporter [Holosporaceae bacterium]|nr:MFS transporter [Holosporaceae bacterium]